jgi:hypothetical protein
MSQTRREMLSNSRAHQVANPKRENACVAAAIWGGADALEQCARDAG